MAQDNTSFSNKTKALQAILQKKKNRLNAQSETELFPLRGEAASASDGSEVSLFSEKFSKASGKPADVASDTDEGISEAIINEAFQQAVEETAAEEEMIAEEYPKEEPLEITEPVVEDTDKEEMQEKLEAGAEEVPAEVKAEPMAAADAVFEDTEKEVFQETIEDTVRETAIAEAEGITEEYPKEELPEVTEETLDDPEKEAFRETIEDAVRETAIAEAEGIVDRSEKELPAAAEETLDDPEKEAFRLTIEEPAAEAVCTEVIAEEYSKDGPLEVTKEIVEDAEKEAFQEKAEAPVTEPVAEAIPEEYSKDEPLEIPEEIPEDIEKEAVQAAAAAFSADESKPAGKIREEIPAEKKTEKDLIREKAEDFCANVISSMRKAAEKKGIQPGSAIEALYSVGLNSLMREGLFVRFLKTKNRISWDGESLADYHTVKDDKNYADELIVSIAECLQELGLNSKFYYMYSDYNRSGDAVKELGICEKGHFAKENALREACPKDCMITPAKPGEALVIRSDNQYGYQKTKLLVVVSGELKESGGASLTEEQKAEAGKAFAGAGNGEEAVCGKKVVEFTSFCASLLKKNGYENVAVIPAFGGHGLDIIAFRDRVKFGVQCICDARPIGVPVIRETIAGRNYYGCHVAVVMTDGAIAREAAELARRNGIVLWDDAVIAKFEKTTYRNCCTEI